MPVFHVCVWHGYSRNLHCGEILNIQFQLLNILIRSSHLELLLSGFLVCFNEEVGLGLQPAGRAGQPECCLRWADSNYSPVASQKCVLVITSRATGGHTTAGVTAVPSAASLPPLFPVIREIQSFCQHVLASSLDTQLRGRFVQSPQLEHFRVPPQTGRDTAEVKCTSYDVWTMRACLTRPAARADSITRGGNCGLSCGESGTILSSLLFTASV